MTRLAKSRERMGRVSFNTNLSTMDFSAKQIAYRYPWVLALDADERPDAELIAELQVIANTKANEFAAYRVRRKDHFMGRWIKHSTLYPSWFLRFYRPERVRYSSRAVHEYPDVNGPVGSLRGHLLHFSFAKGLEDWLLKHVRYARFEAMENLKSMEPGAAGVDVKGLFSIRNPIRRRRALKELSFRLPLRPFLRFAYMYFLRGGFLDGVAGYHYCRMLAMYESMILLHLNELRHSANVEQSRDSLAEKTTTDFCNDVRDRSKATSTAS
jgi:hypothetical protein